MSLEDIEAREKFLFTLEWLLAVTRRYSEGLHFGLAYIDYEPPRTLSETYGAQKTALKLDEVLHTLRKAFRKTDLVARDWADFWILVPYTPPDEKLIDKIKYIVETASQSGLQIVERDISIYSLSPDMINPCEDCSASGFLAYVKENRTALARREISLPESD